MKKITLILLALSFSWFACNSQSWKEADALREKFLAQEKFDSTLYYANEAAALVRGEMGENNLTYCHVLHNLAISHYYLRNYRKAKYFILKEASTREALKKTNDQDYVICNEVASVICRKAGSYEDALVAIKNADYKALDIYSSEGPLYADLLEYYAGV